MKTKRNLLVSIMAMVMALCAFCGIMTMTKPTTAMAANETFYVEDAASIKMSGSGLRFFAAMDADLKAKAEANGYGFLIFPNSYYTDLTTLKDADLETVDFISTDVLSKRVQIQGDVTKIYSYDETLWAANAVISDLQLESFDIEFTCVAYILNEDKTTVYDYAYNTSLAKSAYKTAIKASLDVENVDVNQLFEVYGEHEETDRINYGFGGTNPVLLSDESDLSALSQAVQKGEKYSGINFKLTNEVTLSESYTPIPKTFAGKLDAGRLNVVSADNIALTAEATERYNAMLSSNKFAEIVDGDWVGKYAYNMTSSGRIYAGDYANYFATASDMESIIEGDYDGDAVKVALANSNGMFMKSLDDYLIKRLEEKYTHVKLYIAVVPKETLTDGWSIPINNMERWGTSTHAISYAEEMTVNGATSYIPGNAIKSRTFYFNADNANKWVEFNIPIRYFIQNSPTEGIIKLFSFGDAAPGSGTANPVAGKVTFYISDAMLVNKENTDGKILSINENNWFRIYNSNHGTNSYVANADIPEDIIGDYNGNAVSIAQTSAGTQGTFSADISLSEAQRESISVKYNFVRLWLAIDLAVAVSGHYNTCGNGLLASAGITSISNCYGRWNSYLIPISDFFDYINTDDGSIALFTSYNSNGDDRTFYLGDIELVSMAAGIDKKYSSWDGAQAQKNNYDVGGPSIYHNWYYTRYISNADVRALGFDATTAGNYLYCKWGTASTTSYNDYMRITNTWTDEQLTELAKTYNTVKFTLGIDDQRAAENVPEGWYCKVGGGLMNLANETTAYGDDGTKGYTFTAADDLKWVEFTVDMDAYVEYAKGKKVLDFFKRLETSNSNLWMYISSIEFTNAE